MKDRQGTVSRRSFLRLGLAGGAGVAASLAAVPAFGEESDASSSTTNADASKMPDPSKRVVFLAGSWKDMGRQYAAQCADVATMSMSPTVNLSGSYGLMSKSQYAWFQGNATDVVDFFDGVAEGLGTSIDDLLYDDPSTSGDQESCCTLATWGSQTADGRLLVGSNMDASATQVYYYPAVVAFPTDGHAFVSPAGTKGNCVMNDAGLVLAQSSGQHAAEGDTGEGMPLVLSLGFIAAQASTVDEAEALFKDTYPTNTGDNMQIHDASGNHVICERTASKWATRKPGDFGEVDYSITTNDFMTDALQDSILPEGSGYDDCRPRYWSLEEYVKENSGAVDLQVLADALSLNRWYEDGEWHEVDWDATVGLNSPENESPFFECLVKTLADPTNLTMYVMNGCANVESTSLPYATGNFGQIVLGATPSDVVTSARGTAVMQMFMGGRDISGTDGADGSRTAHLDQSKRDFVIAENYAELANLASTDDERNALLGKAASAYLRCQCEAQLAQNDTAAVVRDLLYNA